MKVTKNKLKIRVFYCFFGIAFFGDAEPISPTEDQKKLWFHAESCRYEKRFFRRRLTVGVFEAAPEPTAEFEDWVELFGAWSGLDLEAEAAPAEADLSTSSW